MKILLITSDSYGCNGGIAQYNRDLLECLSTFMHVRRLVVVARNKQFEFINTPQKISYVRFSTHNNFNFAIAITCQLLFKYDFVICGHINLLSFAALVALRSKCPFVLIIYGIEVWTRPNNIMRWLASRAKAIWSISEFTRRRANEWLRMPLEKYFLLPNAIQLESYGQKLPSLKNIERYRSDFTKILMTLGRLASTERYKGIDEILDVIPDILKIYPKLRYLIVGDGDDRERLELKVIQLGIQNNVYFTGYVPEKDKADIYSIADAFAMPSRGEGFGFVFLEAMACGTPVVASTIDGSYEAVLEGDIGGAVNPNDRLSLISAILFALSQPKAVPIKLKYFSLGSYKNRLSEAINNLDLKFNAK